jgi:probable HAF family extracellular repeat protein
MSPSSSLSSLVAVGALLAASAARGNDYVLVDLGVHRTPLAVNDRGEIAGFDRRADRAVRYRGGRWHFLARVGSTAWSGAIDARGDVVGVDGNAAVIWGADGTRQLLPMPQAVQVSVAEGVTDDSSTVGYFVPSNGDQRDHCFLSHPNGSSRDLGFMPHGDECVAVAINKQGQIVGGANVAAGQFTHAFLWEDGQMHDLGVLPGGDLSVALAINVHGDVVGYSDTQPGAERPHAVLWSGGVQMDIGQSDAFVQSLAYAINDSGEIVGEADEAASGATRATRFADGQVIELESEVAELGDWKLRHAYGINNDGVIVGEGVHADRLHGFMLVPKGAR